MPDSMSPFAVAVIGPPDQRRYALRRDNSEPAIYYTGSAADAWTGDIRKARLYANLDDLGRDLHEGVRQELAHLPQVEYRLDLKVVAIGKTTQEQVRQFIHDNLTVGLDYENPGPGVGTLVLVRIDTGSLRPDDAVQEDPETSGNEG